MGKISWRKTQLPTSVFLPREFHGQRSLVGYIVQGVIQSMGWQRMGHDWVTDTFTFKCLLFCKGFPCGSAGKESYCNAGDLGWEDPLEKGKATHSSILAWRSPRTIQSTGLQKVRTWLTDFHFTFAILHLYANTLSHLSFTRFLKSHHFLRKILWLRD